MTESVNQCIVCGDQSGADPLYAGIVRCRRCAYVFADLHLTDGELAALYHDGYFRGEEYEDYAAEKEILQRNFRLRFATLRRFLRPERHRHLFEIGSAYGFFLDVVRDHFVSVGGIDVTDEGVRYAREHLNLDVVAGDFLKQDFGDQRFDVVCLWDTIEHLRAPDRYLEKIGAHTERGALLAITTGDIESLTARFRKERWRLIHPPTHAHYFSLRTLARLLNKYGFELVYHRHCGFFRSLGRMLHNILVLRHRKPRLYDAVERLGAGNLSFYLNLYDIMYVIARKR